MDLLLKIVKQTSWQILGKLISGLSTFLILGLINSNYSEYGTGVYTLALTYLAFFFLAADLGLNTYVLPKLDNSLSEASRLFVLRLFWALVLVVLANLLIYVLPFNNQLFRSSVLIGSLSIICAALYNSTNLIFQKHIRYDQSVIASSIGAVSSLLVILYISRLNLPINYLAIGPLVGWILNSISSLVLVSRFYKFRFLLTNVNFKYILYLLKDSWPISATLLLNTLYFRLDTFILGYYKSFSDVGGYNLAYSIFQYILVLPTFIMNGFYPVMLKSLKEDKDGFFYQVKMLSIILISFAFVATIFIWVFSPFIIKVLSGGENSTTSLRILSLSLPAYFISSLLMWTYLSLRKYKAMVKIYTIGLMVNIILNVIFIPGYSFIAASWITGISEYLILALLIVILLRNRKSNKNGG